MGNEKESTSTETVICLRSFKRLKNTKGDIERHFKSIGFEAREVLLEKDSGRRGGSYTAVVSLTGKNTTSILKKRFLNINKRKVYLEGLNVDKVHLELAPMVTKFPPRPDHAAACPLKRLPFDAWHLVCQHLYQEDLRCLQLVCSCGYGLVRQLEVQTRRCLSLRTEPRLWNILRDYGYLQRYLLRFNLENLQRLQLQMFAFRMMPLPRDFFAFLACHCPQLSELCLEAVTFQIFRQQMICSTAFEHLTHLEVSCDHPANSCFIDCFPSEALTAVIKSAKKLKHVKLNKVVFRMNTFDILPEGVESLFLDGWFNVMPTDVLISRFTNSLRRLSMSVRLLYPRRVGVAPPPPEGSLLQLAVLHTLKLYSNALHLPVERRPMSSLQHLELHHPRDFTQESVDALGACCPGLKFLLLRRRYQGSEEALDLRPLAALEELRMPQYIDFVTFTNRLPPSLRVLQIRMRSQLVLGFPDTDDHLLPTLRYFEFLLILPQLEYLECGPIFYPRRSFLIDILNRRRGFPFLTIAQKTIGVQGEDVEQVGKSFRFLEYHQPDRAMRAGLRLERDL